MMKKHIARISITILFFFFGGCGASWASRIPTIKDAMKVSDSAWGFVLLYISIGTLITLPFAGNIVKKIGSKKGTIFFLVSYLLLLIGIGFWDSLLLLKLNLVVFGALGNMTNIAINTQALNISKQYKGQIIGSLHGTWSIGGFIASWIGAEMIGLSVPPLNHFLVYSSIAIVLSIILFRNLLEDEIVDNNLEIKHTSKFVFPDKNLFLLGFLAFLAMVIEGTMMDWSSEYMKHIVKAPQDLIGYGLTAYMFMMASGRFLSDIVVHKLGPKITIFISGLLIFIGLLSAVIFPTINSTIFSFMIVGIGVSGIVPLVYNTAGSNGKIPTEQALTIITSIGFIGFFLGPPVIGFVAQTFSLKNAFFGIAFFGIAITLVCNFIDFKTKKQESSI